MKSLLLCLFLWTCATSRLIAQEADSVALSALGRLQKAADADVNTRYELLGTISPQGASAADRAEIVTILSGFLDSSYPDIRSRAADVLGLFEADAAPAIPALLNRVGDDEQIMSLAPVWKAVSLALARIGVDATLDPLLNELKTTDPANTDSDEEAAELRSKYYGISNAIAEMGESARAAAPIYLDLLKRGPENRRWATMYTLSKFGDASLPAIPEYIKSLDHENFNMKVMACRALAEHGAASRAAVPKLLPLLEKKNNMLSTRTHAAMCLGAIGPVEGVDLVSHFEEMISENNAFSQERGLVALGRLGRHAEHARKFVEEQFSRPNFSQQPEAARTLWQLTGNAGPTIAILLEHIDDLTYQDRVFRVIEEMGPAAGALADDVARRLQTDDQSLRQMLVGLLVAMGPAGAEHLAAIEAARENATPDTAFVIDKAIAKLTRKPNVLLILVDDLKPALGCYGDRFAKTPNIDRLAGKGTRFELAFCNQAVCAPSRFSLMLGSHSTSTGLYGLGSPLRRVVPDAVTMPQYFSRHGYRTESLGKIFHIGHGNLGDPESFDVEHFHEKVIEYLEPASTDGGKLTREEAYFTNQKLGQIHSLPRGAAYESPDVEDERYADGRVAAETIKRLEAAKRRRNQDGTPFFIAAGFARPHLPFSAPKKYWDQFDPSTLPTPEFEDLPAGAPAVAGKRRGEIAMYKPYPDKGPPSAELKRNLIHGYYASASYVDAQIGKVTDALERLELAKDTIVVLWGDHGFHLGDLGIWTKHTNYEQANRIPIIIVAPGVTTPGTSTRQLAESVDIYPTVAELAGLQHPPGPQRIDGVSLVPVLQDTAQRVRDHAYHAYPKRKLGRAIRTERYRFVEWKAPFDPPENAEYELYDYHTDPHETKNLAAANPDVVNRMMEILKQYPTPVTSGRWKKKSN